MNSCYRLRWFQWMLFFLLLLAGGIAHAQSPLNVTITVLPPYSPDLSVWLANPNRILITVQNQDLTRAYDFRLSGFAENTDGSTRIETKDEYPVNALRIDPGTVRTLNLNDFKIFDGNAVRFKGADKDLIGRTKLLPEGVYRVCVRALEFKTLAPLSPQEPSGCATFVIRTADEPEPLQPTCGQVVMATKPQLIQFQWTIPPGAPPGTQYRFKMVPIVKGQSPQQAMKAATSPAFFEQTANGPTLLYGPADPPLTSGTNYAWQVQAVDPSGNLAFRNNGFSNVCSFQWNNITPLVKDSITSPIKITDKPIDLVDLPITPDTIGIKKLDTLPFIKAEEIQLGKTFGCVTLTPLAAKQTEIGQRTMQFAGYAEPGINLDAVTGAEVEVFISDRRTNLPYDLVGSKSQPVFSRKLKGSVSAGIIATKGKGTDRTYFELAFANGNDGFTPKKGVDYAWRFTLEFNGKTIRNDAGVCVDKRATSIFERFPDLIIAKKLPDTLIAGGFTIVVEDWDASSKSADPSRPSGIGRVKFDCNGGKKPKPWWLGTIGVIRKNFDVVGAVSDSAKQLAVTEAIYVEPTAKIGDVVSLDLPAGSITSVRETVINRNALLDIFKKNTPDGIRVAFRDVTWDSPTERTEVLTDGIAIYPSSSPVPTPPAEITLDSAFALAIDSLIIRPASASVKGAVLLPTSIISNDTCTRARVPFPMTTITSTCEFYQEVADGDYGQWHIGETGLLVYGRGYTVDFSSAQSPAGLVPPLAASWKGVKLNAGTTPDSPLDSIISNRGYVKAKYTFVNGLITGSGFAARLNMGGGFVYHALDPFGYQINLTGGGYLRVASSAIENGEFPNTTLRLPFAAISTAGSSMVRVDVANITLKIQADQDQFAELVMKDNLAWGEYSKKPTSPRRYYLINGTATDIPAHFYLGARWMPPFYPLADTTFTTPIFAPATTQLETQRIQGVTIPRISNVPLMIVTRDRPNPNDGLKFPAETVVGIWMNVARTGVHTEITLRVQKDRMGEVEMGPVWETGPAYAGEAPFKTSFGFDPKKKDQSRGIMKLQFVESAVWHSELLGSVKLPMPVDAEIDFKQMMFTSTAECAGGQVDLSQPDTMAYWGVGLVPKDPTKSAGILCVKLGVIYLTAAGFNEPRHFAKPFYLVWGEMKASGNMGRLAFDYNSVGQKFDRFGFSPELVKLSPYIPSDSGHVLAYGSVAINFFGSKRLSIVDYKSLKLNNPFNGRYVRVLDTAYMGARPSELAWQRNWGDGIANLDYDSIRYHVDRQDGFFGSGEVDLFNITGGMYSTIDIAAEGICFRVMEESAHTFALGPVAQMSAMGNIWGCGCIVGESLEKIAIGGEISSSLGIGFSIAARGGNMVSMIMSYSPTRFVMEANGAMFVNIGAVDLEVTGLASFTVERGEETFAEGYFRGTVNLGAVIAGVEGEGEFDWHLGTDYQSVQGRVAVRIWSYMGGVGAQTGIFFGHNVPKDRVWVMDGINGRFGLNKGGLPARLTGFYAFLNVEASVSFYFLASGGFQLYVGMGAFVHDSPFIGGTSVPGLAFPYFVGNVGVRIWGEILGGLVSAAAWGNLQFTGAIPPAFEGTIGLEGCVVWVLCGSVDITCGYNRTDGFYMH